MVRIPGSSVFRALPQNHWSKSGLVSFRHHLEETYGQIFI